MTKSLVPTRENIVPIRLSDVELELLLDGAATAGVNRCEFIREAAKEKARRLTRRKKTDDGDEVA